MNRTREQAMAVINCIRLDLGATMNMLEYLINLVPSGSTRNAITEVNIKLGLLRVDLANIAASMEEQNGLR